MPSCSPSARTRTAAFSGRCPGSSSSPTAGVGHGKKAARHIDAWLRGTEYRPAPKHPIVSFEMLHLPVYSDAERSAQSRLPVEERMRSFTEVQAGLGAKEATYEAKRCLS